MNSQNVPPQSIVIGWVGRMGSGKTLNMTKWALLFSEKLQMPIYCRNHIVGATHFEDFTELENLQDIIVVYDEIHIDFDSRDWDNKKRYQFTQWFTQIRKKGIIFFYTTQRINTLEKRIRENTDYLFMCANAGRTEYLLDTQLSIDGSLINTIINEKPYLFYGLYDTREVIKKDFYKGN